MTILLLLLACATTSDSSSEDTGYDWGTPENPDKDGDGITPGGGDCDDTDPTIKPQADEFWYDGIDQNCDGNDEDQDGDGYTGGSDGSGEDCNDADPSFHPNPSGVSPEDRVVDSWEECLDRDCDGKVFHAAWEEESFLAWGLSGHAVLTVYDNSGTAIFSDLLEMGTTYTVDVPVDHSQTGLVFFLNVADLVTPENVQTNLLRWGAEPSRALLEEIEENPALQDAYRISDPTTWACQ